MKTKLHTLILTAAAAVTLLFTGCATGQAQEGFHTAALTNSAMPTVYAPLNGTNTVTVTNAQDLASAATGTLIDLRGFQNVPVTWTLGAYADGAGTSNVVAYLDLSVDGNVWITQALSNTLALVGTTTNAHYTRYTITNGANVFTGFKYARWSETSTTQTNSVHVVLNSLQSFY
ncbi:MAG: hypothetical protein KGL39_34115 [Patescibacteria group bacterium]|nr:hypothetical protein [Patescibacteria group bacterium]